MNAEEIYARLGRLMEAAPDLAAADYKDLQSWFGKVYAMLSAAGMSVDAADVAAATNRMGNGAAEPYWRVTGALHRALAVARS